MSEGQEVAWNAPAHMRLPQPVRAAVEAVPYVPVAQHLAAIGGIYASAGEDELHLFLTMGAMAAAAEAVLAVLEMEPQRLPGLSGALDELVHVLAENAPAVPIASLY